MFCLFQRVKLRNVILAADTVCRCWWWDSEPLLGFRLGASRSSVFSHSFSLLRLAACGFFAPLIGKKERHPQGMPFFLVPVVGLEPTRCRHQRILSPSRLPIPSHRRMQLVVRSNNMRILPQRRQKVKRKFAFFRRNRKIFLSSARFFSPSLVKSL